MGLTKSIYFKFKGTHNQINNFKIEDKELNEIIQFTESNIENDISEYGKYQKISGGLVLVMFYQLWEDKYRKAIADKLNIKKDDLKSDLFGDLRRLRQSIVHNHFHPISELKKVKILNFMIFKDLELNLSSTEISKLYFQLIQEIDQFEFYANS